MRILIISDVHGNLPALEYVLRVERTADLVVSLGDVVNYGPWSNECVELLETLPNKILLKGNHEEAFISGTYLGNHPVAHAFFLFCYPSFNQINLIKNYISTYTYNEFNFVHTLNDTYIFPDTRITMQRNTFIGHSHRMFSKIADNFRLINVGSVGQNRLNIDELNYVIWTPEENKVDLITKEFNADGLICEMKSRKYPEICMNYILSKRIQKA